MAGMAQFTIIAELSIGIQYLIDECDNNEEDRRTSVERKTIMQNKILAFKVLFVVVVIVALVNYIISFYLEVFIDKMHENNVSRLQISTWYFAIGTLLLVATIRLVFLVRKNYDHAFERSAKNLLKIMGVFTFAMAYRLSLYIAEYIGSIDDIRLNSPLWYTLMECISYILCEFLPFLVTGTIHFYSLRNQMMQSESLTKQSIMNRDENSPRMKMQQL